MGVKHVAYAFHPARIRFRTLGVVLLTFLVITAAVSGGRDSTTETGSEPADNRYVKVAYYKEKSTSRNPSLHYVMLVEFGVTTASIGKFEYGLLVDKPDLIERYSLAYFGSPGEDVCPDGRILNASGSQLSEQDQQAGFYGATAGEFSLSPRRSLYARIYSKEPLVLINCFIERTDGLGRAREAWDDSLQLQVVDGQRCVNGPFTYEPYQGD